MIGGMDILTLESKSDVLVFDVESRSWDLSFPSLNVARKSCASFFDGRTIFAAGGVDVNSIDGVKSCEKFCLETKSWIKIDDLPKGLKNASLVCAERVNIPVRLMKNYEDLGRSNVRVT